jgi:hypothetical protein
MLVAQGKVAVAQHLRIELWQLDWGRTVVGA